MSDAKATISPATQADDTQTLILLGQIAEDLRTLAWLHAAERAPTIWLALHAAGFPVGLAGVHSQEPESLAMDQALEQLRADHAAAPTKAADHLAVDFADIYLTHSLRASPFESVWRDEDHLMMQGPTFAVREAYRQHDRVVANRRAMPDDHLSHELSFVAHLLDGGHRDAARAFMDQHLMRWLPEFAQRVAQRAATPVYAALAVLTLKTCSNLRQTLGGQAACASR
jgi:TorA maturation chaperone TorD